MIKISNQLYNVLNEIDVSCGPEDLEDCHRIKGDRTIVKFSSRRKSSKALRKKKKLKDTDGSKFDLTLESVNTKSLPILQRIMGKM